MLDEQGVEFIFEESLHAIFYGFLVSVGGCFLDKNFDGPNILDEGLFKIAVKHEIRRDQERVHLLPNILRDVRSEAI